LSDGLEERQVTELIPTVIYGMGEKLWDGNYSVKKDLQNRDPTP